MCAFFLLATTKKSAKHKKCMYSAGATIHHRGLIFLWRALKIATLSRLCVIYRLGQYAN